MQKSMGISAKYTDLLLGGASIDVHGVPLTDERWLRQRNVTRY